MYFFEYLAGTTKLSKAKKIFHSKINYFGEFIRSVIEAKSSYAGKSAYAVYAARYVLLPSY